MIVGDPLGTVFFVNGHCLLKMQKHLHQTGYKFDQSFRKLFITLKRKAESLNIMVTHYGSHSYLISTLIRQVTLQWGAAQGPGGE